MIALFTKLLDWFKALFWKEEMELTLVGLQYSGKTTFVNVIALCCPECSVFYLPSLLGLSCGAGVAVVFSSKRVQLQFSFAPTVSLVELHRSERKPGLAFRLTCVMSGQFSEDMIPTVGFNMRKITKGNVTIKLWDIGGQPRFRSMWERYCRGVSAIV
ncbi:hypothetical protein NFI96_017186 [Prochilodus magdalenae]|nr:hypothetical protein NFI96_017186 [Prochilodus magdalenae]